MVCRASWYCNFILLDRLHSDHKFKPLSDSGEHKFSLSLLKLKKVHSDGINGENIRLAIVERNYNCQHESLKGLNLTGPAYTPSESFNHGTSVVAIAAGKECTYGECTFPGGVAQGVTVQVFPVTDEISSLTKALADIESSETSFDVVSISYGRLSKPEKEDDKKIGDHIDTLTSKGTLIFAAAGNCGDVDPVLYPARLRNVLSVASLTIGAKVADNAKEDDIDVYCYGHKVVAPAGSGSELHKVRGSSMATPAVAGLACLVLQCAKGKYNVRRVSTMKYIINKKLREGQTQYAFSPETFLKLAHRDPSVFDDL